MEFKFDAATLEMIQNLVYPLVKSLAGFDTKEWVGEQSELFIAVGDGIVDVGTLFILAGTALEDGLVTEDELKEIIASAITLPLAIERISNLFEDDISEPTE